jgi:hypothetical protein
MLIYNPGYQNLCGVDFVVRRVVNIAFEHVPRNPLVRPHSNNTSKQYDVLITRGKMKTLAIRSDFDFKFSGFRVLI